MRGEAGAAAWGTERPKAAGEGTRRDLRERMPGTGGGPRVPRALTAPGTSGPLPVGQDHVRMRGSVRGHQCEGTGQKCWCALPQCAGGQAPRDEVSLWF